MYPRVIQLPEDETFFLWGARQTGKSTLLNQRFPNALRIDLLKSDIHYRYMKEPWLLRERLEASPREFVVIDEVQKLPELLNEVHWLIENRGIRFALCGSSARKVKRGHANLLGGRALRFELHGLTAKELGEEFDLLKMVNRGYLPTHYASERYPQKLSAYVADYLKEEIASEGLVRKLPNFSKFLDLAAISDTEFVNYSTFARDVGVSSETIRQFYEILKDTLIGSFLPGYQKKLKRRQIFKDKFYFFDVGVVNHLARRKNIEPKTEQFGKAFENWIFHEIQSYNAYHNINAEISYWRLASGIEVDFIIGDFSVAIECKAVEKVNGDHLKGLRTMQEEVTQSIKRFLVCLEPQSRKTEDGIYILSVNDFIQKLWDEKSIFS